MFESSHKKPDKDQEASSGIRHSAAIEKGFSQSTQGKE